MNWLIEYFRKSFCRHDWEFLAKNTVYSDPDTKLPISHVWIYRCRKCGKTNKVKSN